jgi:hypothetical protein
LSIELKNIAREKTKPIQAVKSGIVSKGTDDKKNLVIIVNSVSMTYSIEKLTNQSLNIY